MRLIVGLGNPGRAYQGTRHNLGFAVMEPMARFRLEKKFQARLARLNDDTILCLPQTFMNASGQAVAGIAHYYRIAARDIWVVHDEIDLALGVIRISHDSSAAGHRGVGSIISELQTQALWRVRLGIRSHAPNTLSADAFVLQKFAPDEQPIVQATITATQQLLQQALKQGLRKNTTNVQLSV